MIALQCGGDCLAVQLTEALSSDLNETSLKILSGVLTCDCLYIIETFVMTESIPRLTHEQGENGNAGHGRAEQKSKQWKRKSVD